MDNTKLDLPPATWEEFIDKQVATHIAKNHDYGHSFMQALLQHGDIIWWWEVKKKLDRLRTWINKGVLKVKGEGCNNSVCDLFNYTVQFHIWGRIKAVEDRSPNLDDWLSEERFRLEATWLCAYKWVEFLISEDMIRPEETELQALILRYMGAKLHD